MRVGLYGGGFDPPHLGHVMSVAYALATDTLDEVWVLPCWRHAFDKKMADFDHRVAMCRRAFKMFGDRVKVYEFERDFETKYTIDLVAKLRDLLKLEFVLIVGSDNLRESQRWHRWDDLVKMVTVLSIPRGSVDISREPVYLPDISSTQVRQAFLEGQPAKAQLFLPRSVSSYIQDNSLYLA